MSYEELEKILYDVLKGITELNDRNEILQTKYEKLLESVTNKEKMD